jgi:hypothetical protein
VEKLDIKEESGYTGAFTRQSAKQALYRNGARVVKVNGEAGDVTPTGTAGTVLGSIYVPKEGTGYFIEWDTSPRLAIFIIENRLAAVQ